MIKLNFLTVALISAGVLTAPTLAFADPAAADQASPASVATDNAQNSGSKLPEVIVTAQKRPQSSSKVSLSLAVVGADDLKAKGISSAANLTEQVPNIQIGGGNLNAMEIVIRGIGSSTNTEVGDPEAAFHIDGVYLARPQGAAAPFFDLERVEVLRGPQGTLYGRNANAGAINLVTKKPGSKLEGALDLEIGNYNKRKVDAMINVPVSDALAFRAVVSKAKFDGYTNAHFVAGNTVKVDDQDNLSARVQALLKFSPSSSWLLGVDNSKTSDYGPGIFTLVNGKIIDDKNASILVTPKVNDRTSGVTSELKIGLGNADLTYLYGHRKASTDELTSLAPAGVYYNLMNENKQDSHEVRLNSANAGPLQWVSGAFYFKQTGYLNEPLYLAGKPSALGLPSVLDAMLGAPASVCSPMPACFQYQAFINGPTVTEAKAVFGQVTYSVANDWRAIAGLRESKDSRERTGKTVVLQGLQPDVINAAAVSSNKLTYKVGIEHDLSASQMAYLTLSTGYKAGGFSDGNQISPTTSGYTTKLYYAPETITALEGGVKGRFLDGKVRLGASAFYYDYSNLQVSSAINLVLKTVNAAKAKVSGLELEGVGLVSNSARVNFGLGLLSAKYDQYTTAGGTDYSGHTLDRAPKATLTLGYTHDWELDGDRLFSAYIGSRYTSSYNLTDPGNASGPAPFGAVSFVQPSTSKSDLVLTYSGAMERWKIEAFVKNIEDKRTIGSLTSVSAAVEGVYLSEPRTFGLRAGVKF